MIEGLQLLYIGFTISKASDKSIGGGSVLKRQLVDTGIPTVLWKVYFKSQFGFIKNVKT